MQPSRIAVLAAVTALALSGCSGFTFDGSSTSPERTVTPAPVPEPADAPPGLGPDGVIDTSRVGATHGSILENTGYTVVSNRTVTSSNGTVRSDVRTRVARQPNGTFRANITIRGAQAPVLLGRPPARATFWSGGDRYFRKLARDNDTIYNEFTPSDGFAGTMSFWINWVALDGPPERDAATVLGSFRSLTVRETPAADGAYVVRGRDLTAEESVTGRLTEPDDAVLVARIRSDGLITSYRFSYTAATGDGTRVRAQRCVRFEAVGETTVSRPAWIDRVVNDTTPTPAA